MLSFWEKSRVWRAFLPNVGTLPRRFFLQILICVANSPTLVEVEDFSFLCTCSGNFIVAPTLILEENAIKRKKSNIWLGIENEIASILLLEKIVLDSTFSIDQFSGA